MSPRSAPCRVSLRVDGRDRPAFPLEISGHRAALRLAEPLETDASVAVTLSWSDGGSTTLPGRVRSVSRRRPDLHVAHVDVHAVEGDWRSFLEYLGPTAVR